MIEMSPVKLRKIRGEMPKKREIADWSETKIVQFIRFTQHFMKDAMVKKAPTQVFDFTDSKLDAARMADEDYWPEFLARLETSEAMTLLLRKQRLMMMTRTVGSWLKQNPHAITTPMLQLIKPNDRWNWVLTTFKTNEAGVVVQDQRETTDPGRANANPHQTDVKPPMVIYQDALFKLASILTDLTKGLSYSDIKKMPVKDRIQLAERLSQTLGKAFSGRGGNIQVFKTLVVNQATKQDLESAVLEYSAPQENESDS